MLVIVWLIIECEKDRGNILSRHLPYRSRHFHLLQLASSVLRSAEGSPEGERKIPSAHLWEGPAAKQTLPSNLEWKRRKELEGWRRVVVAQAVPLKSIRHHY